MAIGAGPGGVGLNIWSQLPSANPGLRQPWYAEQQAPWRYQPWQQQQMPSGTPPMSPAQQFGFGPESYLPEGPSSDIPGFEPMQPGGGFYEVPPPPPPPVAPVQPQGFGFGAPRGRVVRVSGRQPEPFEGGPSSYRFVPYGPMGSRMGSGEGYVFR